MDAIWIRHMHNEIRQGYYISNGDNEQKMLQRVDLSINLSRLEKADDIVIKNKPWYPEPAARHFKLNSLWGALKNARKFKKELNNILK